MQTVVDKLSQYLLTSNVQLGAMYSISKESTKLVTETGPAAYKELLVRQRCELAKNLTENRQHECT